ncbi:unnamed protein product [Symbiodinium pilosum]|uniref:Uncharacterized protein n=1 Tax=Symbiodinium pilosum TaxID=2952 RepID=A0A812SAD2_SYMPI|nr:unnamed protein product [Symbiodinium pilosum]
MQDRNPAWEDLKTAMSMVAEAASAQYPELHQIAIELLRSVASRARESGGKSIANYDVLIFRGEPADRRRSLSVRLASVRRGRGKVREAAPGAERVLEMMNNTHHHLLLSTSPL